jgi:ABC-type nitrate/sulfonate/bicarbonate transport system permease component
MSNILKRIFQPFGKINQRIFSTMTIIQVVIVFLLLQILHSPVIPAPSDVMKSLLDLLSSSDFYDNFFSSLFFTIKAMGLAICITTVIVYLSTIPFFKPLAFFISKCRYLTLTGLVFLFTMLTSNVAEVKMSSLIFGIVPYFVTSFLSIIENIPRQEIDKSYVNRRNSWETLYEVIIKGKLDLLFEVMRQNFAISWMMITTVEAYDMSDGGIGVMLLKSNKHLDLGPVFAMLFVILITGVLFDWGLGKLRLVFFEYLQSNN